MIKLNVSYVSDLHLDFHVPYVKNQLKWEKRTREFIQELIKTDDSFKELLVLAGDISHYNHQSYWALDELSTFYEHVVMTIGNHDYYLVSRNQRDKYGNHSSNRVDELVEGVTGNLPNVTIMDNFNGIMFKGFKIVGSTMWYPLETEGQKLFFNAMSNDSKLIKGLNIREKRKEELKSYKKLYSADLIVTHIPIIDIDSHYKYNSTACYLSPMKEFKANKWIMGHSHEQKTYNKTYGTFYMNSLGYPKERLEKVIKHFTLEK